MQSQPDFPSQGMPQPQAVYPPLPNNQYPPDSPMQSAPVWPQQQQTGMPQSAPGWPQQQAGMPQSAPGWPQQQQAGMPQNAPGWPQQQAGMPQSAPGWPQQQGAYPPDGPMQSAPGWPQQQTGMPQSAPGWPQQQGAYPPDGPMQSAPGWPQQQIGMPQTGFPQTGQMPYYVAPVNAAGTVVNVNIQQQQGPGFFVRAIYFIFIGWWAGFWCLQIGFLLCSLIVTLPLGLMLLNRLPQIMTLKPSGSQANVNVATVAHAGGVTNVVNVNISGTKQHPMILRIVYYIFIGCWVGYFWASLGYFFCLTILGLPLGVLILNQLPMVLTLRRN